MIAIDTIAVVGAGAWGTALAMTAVRAKRQVILWGRDSRAIDGILRRRENPRYLPGIEIDPAIQVTNDLADIAGADAIVLVVPAQTVAEVIAKLGQTSTPLVVCAKGLDRGTDRRLSEVIHDQTPDRRIAALSGPNFAREVALGLPAAATLACADEPLGRALAASLSHEQFRLYWTDDVIGVEIGGAVKNVLAIAAGMVDGRRLGENAKAALITRGLAELMRLGEALGARRETLMGLAGLGDLMLTATSQTSRNMAFGMAIGEGANPVRLQQEPGALVEGAATAAAVIRLARQQAAHDLTLPICEAVAAILAGHLDIDQAIEALMTRPLRAETDRYSK